MIAEAEKAHKRLLQAADPGELVVWFLVWKQKQMGVQLKQAGGENGQIPSSCTF